MHLDIGILASHNGSNAQAIIDNIRSGCLDATVRIIISNNPSAGVLMLADKHNIPAACLNARNFPPAYATLDDAMLAVLRASGISLIVLAGYMKKVSPPVLQAYHNRVLNIHPALLPKYGGLGMYGDNVHLAVLRSGDTMTGATVHLVDPQYDQGRIISQCACPRYPDDTLETLSARVLAFEHVLYPQTLKDISEGLIDLDQPKSYLP